MIAQFIVCPDLDECLAQLEFNDHLAVAVSRKHALANRRISNWQIYCLAEEERVFGYPISMFINKDHPLKTNISRLGRMAVEGGLIGKWTKDAQDVMRSEGKHHGRYHPTNALTASQIVLPVIIHGSGLLIAMAIFLGELIVYRMARTRGKYRRYWRKLEWMIDGKQRFFEKKPWI